MRGLVGVALALVGLAPLGIGVLLLTGFWDRTRGILRAGLSVFVGMAAASVLLPPLVYVGLAPSILVVLLLGAVALGLGVAVRRRRPRAHVPEAITLPLAPALVLALPLLLLAARAATKPVDRFDAFANWALKAKLLFFASGHFDLTLDDRLFEDAFATPSLAPPVQRQYPIGLASLESYVLHGIGSVNMNVLHLLFVAFLAGLALALWAFLAPHAKPWALTAGLSFVLWMPSARDQALSAYADVPVACFWVAAAVGIGCWLAGAGRDHLALAGVFAAAGMATKREGLVYGVILLALALAATAVRDRERLRPTAVAALAVLATVVPWQVFVAVNDVTDKRYQVGGQLGRMLEQSVEVPTILRRLLDFALLPDTLVALPLGIAVALLALARGRHRTLALGYLILVAAILLGLIASYMGGTSTLDYLVRTSGRRTLMAPILLSAALLPLLLARALDPEPRRARAATGARSARRPRRSTGRGATTA